jgi:prevent-host-death family protein
MKTSTVGSLNAQNDFSELIDRALHGGETIVTKHGKPVTKIVPFVEEAVEMTDVLTSIAETRNKVSQRGALLEKGESWNNVAREGLRS